MKLFKHIFVPALAAATALVSTSCLEEAFPQDGSLTGEEIADRDKTALAAAMPSYFNISGSESWDLGFASYMIFMDAMTADYPTHEESWDYYRYFNLQVSIGNNGMSQNWWVNYYYMIKRANDVIRLCDTDPESDDAYNLGSALVFRAYSYLDLMRVFEYKRTNVARLDDIADQRGLWGLTVPVVTENTTENDARSNPRVPFWHMFRFINDDLQRAVVYLRDSRSAKAKDMPCLGVAYGMLARLWLEMGSRFDLHAADLQAQLANENNPDIDALAKLNITSANDCFAKAAEYARLTINEGFTPVTRDEWFNLSSGFNTPNNSWLWAIVLSSNDPVVKNTWKSLVSFKCPETTFGMGSLDYGAYRMIDARLYDKIDENDWRRDTWISPGYEAMDDSDDKQQAFKDTYASLTQFDYETFSKYAAYTGFKFRPASGDMKTASVANVVSTPLMRIEEMYLIEAEALAHCQGAAAGKQAIESFMNTYRMKEGTTFTCNATELEDVVDVIWTQKRVELWGEGQVFYDYKRRELPIERGYPGTNHPAAYRFNSYPEAVAPWTNFYIPDRVQSLNLEVKLNPDPQQAITTLWTE